MKITQMMGLFLMGFRDSISLLWVRKILFFSKPLNKQIHPSSIKMQKMIINSFIQVLVFLIALPQFFLFVGLSPIYYALNALFIVLTYGWLFFYTDGIMSATRQVALWSASDNSFGKLHIKQKIEIFTALSGQIKSLIFLVLFYLPIYLIASKVLIHIPIIGMTFLILSEAFFNGAFYFLKLWPYDKYNVGFIEKYWAYMVGFGFSISVICNALLSGSFAVGAYLLISQWMIINCILHGPPQFQFKNVKDVMNPPGPNLRGNAYNSHREKIRSDKDYRKSIVDDIILLKPAMLITDFVNRKLSNVMNASTKNNRMQQQASQVSSANLIQNNPIQQQAQEQSADLQQKNE